MAEKSKELNPKKLIACLNCGQTFEFDKYKSNRKFCNDECRNSYYGIESKKDKIILKECKYCQKTFECCGSTPNKVFCSEECSKNFYHYKYTNNYERKESGNTEKEKGICAHCGKEFSKNSPYITNKKYCSQACLDSAYKQKRQSTFFEIKKCAYCGNDFKWSSSKPNQKYCCKECLKAATLIKIKNYNKKNVDFNEKLRNEVYLKVVEIIGKKNASKGNTIGDRYIDYWQVGKISEKTREEVLKRDNYECYICKRKDTLELHHIVKRKYGGNHEAANLITLCTSCHRHIETGDVEHATTTCFKNAKRYYSLEEESMVLDIDCLKITLNTLFDKLKNSAVSDEFEIMVLLDNALDLLDTST